MITSQPRTSHRETTGTGTPPENSSPSSSLALSLCCALSLCLYASGAAKNLQKNKTFCCGVQREREDQMEGEKEGD
jgi:hypothetical protein